jgi:hypothetical protein
MGGDGTARVEFCSECGRPLDAHDRNIRLRLPESVLGLSEEERAERSWSSPKTDHLEVQGVGSFVRSLLPIQLSGGFSLTYGVWLQVDPATLRRAWEIWDRQDYAGLTLEGRLANAVPPWGERLLQKRVKAIVVDPSELPVIVFGSDPAIDDVLRQVWRHDEVLSVPEL